MEPDQKLKDRIKQLIVENLMLKMSANEIGNDAPLFAPTGLGLDSVDALQLVVALDKSFGLKIADQNTAKMVLESVDTIALAVARKTSAT